LTTSKEIKEFVEARRVLEPEILALAAVNATDDELRLLYNDLKEMEKEVAENIYNSDVS
jgi:DNA-binding GntR family transcriptional regulator